MMTNRAVYMTAGAILAEHGKMTGDYIIHQVTGALNELVAVEDWRRGAAAVDEITGARPQ